MNFEGSFCNSCSGKVWHFMLDKFNVFYFVLKMFLKYKNTCTAWKFVCYRLALCKLLILQ